MDGQTITVEAEVTGMPEVVALAHAARDVVDHALWNDDPDHGDLDPSVPVADLRALAAALAPIMPGLDVE